MKNSSVTEMFNTISATYDKINRVLSINNDRKWRKKLARKIAKDTPLEIVDIATGTGDQIIAFFENNLPVKKVVGVDLAEEMLSIARKKIETKPYKEKVFLQIADALNLPFLENSFDIATIAFGIRNFADPSLGLQQIAKILKKGGKVLILEFSLPSFFIFRAGFSFYLKTLLPFFGGKLSSNKSAYNYLSKTIHTFPSGANFLALMSSAGFTDLKCTPMCMGSVSIYEGTK